MTERRWTDKPDLDPVSVRALPGDHPALLENRTLFPGTVVEVTDRAPERLLVSGRNSRKLGETVAKGRLAGYALYGLTLEERATCPASCEVRDVCYGNGMQLARRHRIGRESVFYDRLEAELGQLARRHREGVLVRLHVLGDFPSVEYICFWADMLEAHPNLACYGYTHRLPGARGGDDIGTAIEVVKGQFPDRFRIRWSAGEALPDGAVVTADLPEGPRTAEGIVCPAQTDATACCASCGLCWEPAARDEAIVFVRHGPRSSAAAASAAMDAAGSAHDKAAGEPEATPSGRRPIVPIALPTSLIPEPVAFAAPTFRMVAPTSLLVEESYQRDLSARSIRLIRKIVSGWEWAKFKPPVCAETPEGLFVIDGQHTAIAAASHPGIVEILVMVVEAPLVETRADAFVSHNRDRLAMSALQIFKAEITAGSAEALSVLRAIAAGGGRIPRTTPMKGRAKPGEVVAIAAARRVHSAQGAERLERLVRVAVRSGVRPINSTVVYGLQLLLQEPRFAEAARLPDAALAAALAAVPDLDAAAQRHAATAGMNRYRACAVLVADAALASPTVAAA